MTYVDGFVLPIPSDRIDDYKKLAEMGGQVWKEYGALDYKECLMDDDSAEMRSFTEMGQAKKGETIIFAFVVFKSREHRDEVNKKVMEDPRIRELSDPENLPFDVKRMAYGGFKTIVEI